MFLSLSILFSISANAFAASQLPFGEPVQDFYTEEIDGGDIFIVITGSKTATIMTSDEEHSINISIKYHDNPDIVYEWSISDYPVATFTPSNDIFWANIIKYAEGHLDEAKVIEFINTTYDPEIQPYSSDAADLMAELAELTGLREYIGEKHSTTYEGQIFRVYEQVTFLNTKVGNASWSQALKVASLITNIIGATVSEPRVKLVCKIFGVALSVASIIAPGSVDKYITTANINRYVTANGSGFPYNSTDKNIWYYGLGNPDSTSDERAGLDTETKTIEYSDYRGETYFNSYSSQVQDAYSVFKVVGQQP